MPLSELALALVHRGVITQDAAMQAEDRQRLYGGGLDTVLLEIQATDEETLTSHLAELIGIPLAPLHMLANPEPTVARWIDVGTAQKLGAAPREMRGDALDVLVRPDHDHDALVTWAGQRSLLVEPFLVCEVRFRALLHKLYGLPVPPRYLALLVKLVGTTQARTAAGAPDAASRTPTPAPANRDPIDTLLATARLGDESARYAALHILRRHLHDRRVIFFRHALEKKAHDADPAVSCGSLRALAELRDKNAVTVVIEFLEGKNEAVAAAAQATLVALTCENLGRKAKRWTEWWAKMGHRPRVEWLLEGLSHRTPELRLLASNELYEISGEYFGYHYDLPERDREEARRRWIEWWQAKNTGNSV